MRCRSTSWERGATCRVAGSTSSNSSSTPIVRGFTSTRYPSRGRIGCGHDSVVGWAHHLSPGRHRGDPGARGVGDHPALDPGGRPRHGRRARRPALGGRVDPRHPARGGSAADRTAVRPAGRGTVPAGRRARLRGARRRHAAGRRRRRDRARVLGRRRDRRDRRRPASTSPTAAASRPTTTTTPRSSRRSSATRSARARAPTSSSAGTTAPSVADWGADKALTVFRRLLERERGAYWTYCFFTGDRYLIGASPERHVSVHGGDVRMNPISGTFRVRAAEGDDRRLKTRLLGVPARREGDLRALHGRRRGAQDDVRHLPRGRPGARPVPQADDPPDPHRVPPRRPHRPRRARGAARHDVRRHGHRHPGRERVPADQAVRARGPRLLRRRAGRCSAATPTASRSSTARS